MASDAVQLNDAPAAGFGAALKRLRRAAGLSQEALAERAGISTQAISALESGLRKSPYPKTVAMLAAALGLDQAGRGDLEAAAAHSKAVRAAHRGRFDLQGGTNGYVPPALTSLVGRELELTEILAGVERGRLVTLTGPGGIGKTSVAVEVARAMTQRLDDGAWFCDLSGVADGRLVPGTIAAVRGVAVRPQQHTTTAICAALRTSSTLLVLDNCEHVLDAAGALATELLHACPGVAILATSRRRLGISLETLYAMPPLSLPDERTAAHLTKERAQEFGAVSLFVQRATAANSAFALTDQIAPDVARICRRLDGIALAIELAAARIRVTSAPEIARHLDRRFRILRDGKRDAAPRHRTLEAAFDWSYELLGEREQAFFGALGIFADTFTLEAALDVCSPGADELEALEMLAALVDASLVVADTQGHTTRYRLLETTRAYALQRLERSGRHDLIAGRHLEHFRRLADETDLSSDLEDVRAALRWALAGGDVCAGAEIAARIGVQWEKLGLAAEGADRMEAFLAAVPSGEALLLARLWAALSFLFGNELRYTPALAAARHAVAYARAAGDETVLFNALRSCAIFSAWEGCYDDAEAALAEAEAIALERPSPVRRLQLFFARGHVSKRRLDYRAAAAAFMEARELARSLGDPYREVNATIHLAEVEHEGGETDSAIARLRELCTDRVLERIDHEAVLANLAGYLAARDDAAGVRAAARELFTPGTPVAASEVKFMNVAFEHVALVDAQHGALQRAARLLGYSTAWYRDLGSPRQFTEARTHERLMAILRERLTASELEALMAEGAAFTIERAVQEGLAGDDRR